MMRRRIWPKSSTTWIGINRRQGRPLRWPRSRAGILSLSELPRSGSYPRELLDLGIREYREVLSHPYRIIYRVLHERVYVLMIADGRRDMQSLLQRRLLQA